MKVVYRIIITSCFVLCCFLPIYIIFDVHTDFILSKTQMSRDATRNWTIVFLVMIMLGTLIGLISWALFELFTLLYFIIVMGLLVNVTCIVFSFMDAQYGYRLILLLMIIGLLIGMAQTTVTTFFANQYVENQYYTLLHHYYLYIAIHIIAALLAKLIVPMNPKDMYGTMQSISDSNAWEFFLSLVLNFVALGNDCKQQQVGETAILTNHIKFIVLAIILSSTAPVKDSKELSIMLIKNIEFKQMLMVFVLYCPLICVWICSRLVEKHWILQYHNLDYWSVIGSHRFVQPIMTLLCIPILLFIVEIRQDDSYRIVMGCLFIAIAVIISGIIDWYADESYHNYYDVPEKDATFRLIFNDGKDYRQIAPKEGILYFHGTFLHFHNIYPIINVSTTWTQYNQTNLTVPSNSKITLREIYYPEFDVVRPLKFRRGSETWNIYKTKKNKLDHYAFDALVYRRASSLPTVYFFQNDPYVDVQFLGDQLNLNVSNQFFHEIPSGYYNVSVKNKSTETFYFERGGLYVVMLFKPTDNDLTSLCRAENDIIASVTVIPPYKFSILYQIPQRVLFALGKIMILSSGLRIAYNLSKPDVQCQGIAVFFFVYDTGYLFYFIVADLMYTTIYDGMLIIPVFILLATAMVQGIVFLWDYNLLPDT